jgi:predicted nucleic acid-binding protein
LKLVLDTCILKLATFAATDNPAALIVELCRHRLVEWWGTPAILDEYQDVLAGEPEFLTEVVGCVELCYPLTTLAVIRHEPDNRFLECALAVRADYLVTVNTARGHFDRRSYDTVGVVTPGRFVNLTSVQPLVQKLSR